MPKHIFINSHDLDTSMIGAQLTGGKGRFADIEGTCFGYKFDFTQLDRNEMPKSIREKITDDWLDAHNLVKFNLSEESASDLDLSAITEEDCEILNAMPEGTYFWHTRHVLEMFKHIDKLDAHIVQLVSRGYEPYFKTILNYQIFEKGVDECSGSIKDLLYEIHTNITNTDRCAMGVAEHQLPVLLCDYETMFDAERFRLKIASPLGIEVNVNRNKKILADYLEENLGSISHASDEEILAVDWSSKYPHKWDSIISPIIKMEMKRAYVSDKKFFTEADNTNQRTVENYTGYVNRDWIDELLHQMKDNYYDTDFDDLIDTMLYADKKIELKKFLEDPN